MIRSKLDNISRKLTQQSMTIGRLLNFQITHIHTAEEVVIELLLG